MNVWKMTHLMEVKVRGLSDFHWAINRLENPKIVDGIHL